jgi:hypothetical protein
MSSLPFTCIDPDSTLPCTALSLCDLQASLLTVLLFPERKIQSGSSNELNDLCPCVLATILSLIRGIEQLQTLLVAQEGLPTGLFREQRDQAPLWVEVITGYVAPFAVIGRQIAREARDSAHRMSPPFSRALMNRSALPLD